MREIKSLTLTPAKKQTLSFNHPTPKAQMSQMNILRPIGNVFVICALIWTGSRLIVETAGIVQLLAQPLFEAAVIQVKVEVETE